MLDHSRDYDFSQFKGQLDVEAAAVMGHSFGGGTTVLTLHDEPRFRYISQLNYCNYANSDLISIYICIPVFFFLLVASY